MVPAWDVMGERKLLLKTCKSFVLDRKRAGY